MLVLSRKVSERINVEGGIVITVVRIAGDKVRLGVVAPGRKILRDELELNEEEEVSEDE